MPKRLCLLAFGTPYRPWWLHLRRQERNWRKALTLALAALSAGCASAPPAKDMAQAAPVDVPYSYGAGKPPQEATR